MNKDRIVVSLWPKGRLFEGKRVDMKDRFICENPTILYLEIAEAELLIAEYKRTPHLFEQEASRSLAAALQEWNEERGKGDEEPHGQA